MSRQPRESEGPKERVSNQSHGPLEEAEEERTVNATANPIDSESEEEVGSTNKPSVREDVLSSTKGKKRKDRMSWRPGLKGKGTKFDLLSREEKGCL